MQVMTVRLIARSFPDVCDPNPCMNDGECEVDGNDYKCECQQFWMGKTCEEENDDASRK